MDIVDVRIVFTLVTFATFLGIVAWAYSRRAQRGFNEAALLPLEDDIDASAGNEASRRSGR